MSVNKYFCKKSGVWYWRVYVQKQSTKHRYIREQKNISKIPIENEKEARSLEKEWKAKLCKIVFKKEAQGCSWGELIDMWEAHYRRYRTNKMSRNTILDHIGRLENYTKSWLKKSCSNIEVGDAYDLFEELKDKAISKGVRVAIKGSINKVYKWGLQRRFIVGVEHSPALGIEIDCDQRDEEEKIPEILTHSEIALFLNRAQAINHPWYYIWKFDLYTGLRSQELNGLRQEDITLMSPIEARKMESVMPRETINYGHIKVKRQWRTKQKSCSGLKGKYWRTIPLNSILYWWLIDYLPKAQFGSDKYGKRVFQKFKDFDNGEQAKVLRTFCESERLKSIKHHTLRACWATQTLRSGIPATDLMNMGGWRDYKTMMIYIRLAGLESVGATEGLNFESGITEKKADMSAVEFSCLLENEEFISENIEGVCLNKQLIQKDQKLPDNVVHLFS